MGQSADGKVKEFVPDSPKVLVVMGLVAPGRSKSMWFIAPPKPATYPYVCTYPSHWRTMNGKMKVTAAPGAPSTAAPPD
jgi:azurin